MNSGIPTECELLAIQKSLASSIYTEVKSGRTKLLDLGDEALAAYFALEHRAAKRRIKRNIAIVVSVIVIYAIVASLVQLPSITVGLGGFGYLFGGALKNSKSYRKALEALASMPNLDGTSELITALQTKDGTLQDQIMEGLTRRFKLLGPGDYDRITPEARNVLVRYLYGRYRYRGKLKHNVGEFECALFQALTFVGDSRFLRTMEVLLDGVGRKISEPSRAAARDCLPALRALVASQASNSQLLRSSSTSNTVAGEELLRPSAEIDSSAHCAELLRPGE